MHAGIVPFRASRLTCAVEQFSSAAQRATSKVEDNESVTALFPSILKYVVNTKHDDRCRANRRNCLVKCC